MPLSPPLPTLSLLPPPSTTMSTADLGEVVSHVMDNGDDDDDDADDVLYVPQRPEYTLSSNPPNPKTSFRLGDWM